MARAKSATNYSDDASAGYFCGVPQTCVSMARAKSATDYSDDASAGVWWAFTCVTAGTRRVCSAARLGDIQYCMRTPLFCAAAPICSSHASPAPTSDTVTDIPSNSPLIQSYSHQHARLPPADNVSLKLQAGINRKQACLVVVSYSVLLILPSDRYVKPASIWGRPMFGRKTKFVSLQKFFYPDF